MFSAKIYKLLGFYTFIKIKMYSYYTFIKIKMWFRYTFIKIAYRQRKFFTLRKSTIGYACQQFHD